MSSITGKTVLAPFAEQLIQRVQSRTSPLEIIYRSHDLWPLPLRTRPGVDNATSPSAGLDAQSRSQSAASPPSILKSPIRISVLDSSFNPPTLAHLALIRSLPPAIPSDSISPILLGEREEATPAADKVSSTDNPTADYDARLLLLSVRNADKSLKPGDATYAQRLEMMIRLAHVLQAHEALRGSETPTSIANVAVAIIDEPTFINKSTVLRSYLREHLTGLAKEAESELAAITSSSTTASSKFVAADVRLTFLMGYDTLERFFAPRYYSGGFVASEGVGPEDSKSIMLAVLRKFFSDIGDGSRVVCAYRSTGSLSQSSLPESGSSRGTSSKEDDNPKDIEDILEPFLRSGWVSLINISKVEAALSSSEVRSRVAKGQVWKSMVVDQVAQFLDEQRLYLNQQIAK